MKDEVEEEDLQVWIRPDKEVKESDVPQLNEEWANDLKAVADENAFQLYLIDSKIEMYNRGLSLLQPHASGRVGVKFWKGKLPGRHPYPIAWKGLGRGKALPLARGQKKDRNKSLTNRTSDKYFYAPIKLGSSGLRLRAKRSGKFLDSVKQVQVILGRIQSLMAMRAKIIENGRSFRIKATLDIAHQKSVLRKMSVEIDELLPRWQAHAEARYDELSERRRDHIVLLEEEEARQLKRGYQFGAKPKKTAG